MRLREWATCLVQDLVCRCIHGVFDRYQYVQLHVTLIGLNMAWKLFPKSLITGTVPSSVSGSKTKRIEPPQRKTFTAEDIDCLDEYLDNVLQDHSIGSKTALLGIYSVT